MPLATVISRAQTGLRAPLVNVEIYVGSGLPSWSIVGLPETAVRESKDRVRPALLYSNYELPDGRITVNLAPAELPKDGSRFDLPIAIGILVASGQLPQGAASGYEFYGELSLNGDLKPFVGALPTALGARRSGRALIVPEQNATEAALVKDLTVLPAVHLLEVCAHLSDEKELSAQPFGASAHIQSIAEDLAQVRGQAHAKRALEIAAAGGHSLLMMGPPGSGKTMMARRLPGILPPLDESEALETASIHSLSGRRFDPERWSRRPFRSPHHTASGVALVGGGSIPRPGEISLAHNGVLFLDELPEFDRRVLEVLREPIESGHIHISRATRQAEFPARFQLVAAMNPCPCGHLGDLDGRCRCTVSQIHRYRARVSGPLLDRIDLHVEVPRLAVELLSKPMTVSESSARVRARVIATRERQIERQEKVNALLNIGELERFCQISPAGQTLLLGALEQLGLSARAYHRVLKVARTIADLDSSEAVGKTHIGEAINLRCLDRRANAY